MNIDKETRKQIKLLKSKIKQRRKEEDKEYAKICKKLGIAMYSSMEESFYDYVFNDYDLQNNWTKTRKT